MRFNVDLLREFVIETLRSDLVYHSERKRSLALYIAAQDALGDIVVPNITCIQIRTFLQSRSDRVTSDSQLAFEVALHKLYDMLP